MENVKVKTEKVDDVPLILHIESEMGIGTIINEVIKPHPNRKGLSIGAMIMVWLSYILSQSDHRMSEVESWAASQITMLKTLIPDEIEAKDFADDKLADGLKMLSKDKDWEEIEKHLGERLIRVYKLEKEAIRLDTTSCAVFHESEDKEIIKYGHSKDHRPDLAQFKVMLATLDPLGLPLITEVVAGNAADDGLYLPAIEKIQKVVGKGNQLYVGDSKMAAKEIRAKIAKSLDYYLCPLPQTGKNPEMLKEKLQLIKSRQQKVKTIYEEQASKKKVKVLALESQREEKEQIEGKIYSWQERVISIYSPKLAIQLRRSLDERIAQAKKKLLALTPVPKKGTRQYTDLCLLQAASQEIIAQYRVGEFFSLEYKKESYFVLNHPTEERLRYQLNLSLNTEAIAQQRELLGWRLYCTNAPETSLSLEKAISTYRSSQGMEHNFSRLKGQPLGLRPLFIKREDHLTGLVRLLSLALKILTLAEFLVRQALLNSNESLPGLYSHSPSRKTSTPTAERLFKAFRGIFLSIIFLPSQTICHLSPLSSLQSRIISLLRLPVSIYQVLISDLQSSFPNSS